MNNVGNVTLLQRGDLTDSHSSGSKFVVDFSALAKETATAQETCDPITSGQPTTEGWLYGLTRLQSIDRCKSLGMNRKKLLEGIFKRRKVVVKVAEVPEDLKREWTTYAMLRDSLASTANILEYICYFTCEDSVADVVKHKVVGESDAAGGHLCDGDGSKMQVLVMEHVDGKSMKNFDWMSESTDAMIACMRQVIFTVLDAHLKCGFVHGDLHLDNVLVERTSLGKMQYGNTSVDTHGLFIKLMDFELSSFDDTSDKHSRKFFDDVLEFFRKALHDLGSYVSTDPLYACYSKARAWSQAARSGDDTPEPSDAVMELDAEVLCLRRYDAGGGGCGPARARSTMLPTIARRRRKEAARA